VATVVHDSVTAQHLSEGRPRSRKFDSTPLARSLHTVAASLFTQVRQRSIRVRS
jgi:hypothetical protein